MKRIKRIRGRRPLIIGNALLFSAAAGCGESSEGSVDVDQRAPGTDQQISRPDLRPPPVTDRALPERDQQLVTDQLVALDLRLALDQSPLADQSVVIDQSSTPDHMLALDRSGPEEDLAPPVLDRAAPEPDRAPPEPDMMAGTCQALEGLPCDFREGCCEANQVRLECRGGRLVVSPEPDLCGCAVPDGRGEIFCAVPGFIGIHRSGWRPARLLRLRGAARS